MTPPHNRAYNKKNCELDYERGTSVIAIASVKLFDILRRICYYIRIEMES